MDLYEALKQISTMEVDDAVAQEDVTAIGVIQNYFEKAKIKWHTTDDKPQIGRQLFLVELAEDGTFYIHNRAFYIKEREDASFISISARGYTDYVANPTLWAYVNAEEEA